MIHRLRNEKNENIGTFISILSWTGWGQSELNVVKRSDIYVVWFLRKSLHTGYSLKKCYAHSAVYGC